MTASDMGSVYSRVIAVLLVLLALAACGGGDDEPAAEQPEKTGESGGLAAYDVPAGGFSLSVPTSWKAATIDEVLDEEGLERVRQEDPELARLIEPLAQPGSPVKFVALDPNVREEFATNVNVYVEDVPEGVTRQEYFDVSVDNLSEAVGAGSIEQGTVQLPAGEARRVAFEQEAAGRQIAQLAYIVFEEGTGYVITYSTLPQFAEEYADTFESSAQTFRLLSER
jgi:hypothetical protein